MCVLVAIMSVIPRFEDGEDDFDEERERTVTVRRAASGLRRNAVRRGRARQPHAGTVYCM